MMMRFFLLLFVLIFPAAAQTVAPGGPSQIMSIYVCSAGKTCSADNARTTYQIKSSQRACVQFAPQIEWSPWLARRFNYVPISGDTFAVGCAPEILP